MPATAKLSDTKSRKVTPPSPSYMSNDQFASYLAELRSNRVARPGGARPQPAGARPAPSSRASTHRSTNGRFSPDAVSQADSLNSKAPSVAAGSIRSRYSTASGRGRDYVPTPGATPLKPGEVVPSATYIERGHRWMEKEEAGSLRDAMEEMDLRKSAKETPTTQDNPDDETRIYTAALDEAAELVWRHEHGKTSPPPGAPYRYRSHLRKNSYANARTASVGDGKHATRSFSGSSSDSDGRPSLDKSQSGEQSSRKSKSYGSVNGRSGQFSERRHGSLKRNISGEVERPFSGDQIWEEPESSPAKGVRPSGRASPEKLSNRPQNPTTRVRFEPLKEESDKPKPIERVEIYRNPPTRSRNPQYTTNSASETPPPVDDKVERISGMEVRSQDIRAATSMRLKDRSPNLPEPSAVSDSPGRPIVSFDASWKAPDESTDITPDRSIPAASSSSFKSAAKPMAIPSIVVAEESASMSSTANIPSISVAGPDDGPRGSIPSINVPSINIPTINVPTIAVDEAPSDSNIPAIVTPDDKPAARARPLPTPTATGPPRRAQRPRGHWSPAPGNTARGHTICHECGFPIEGRFVALAGGSERFHPKCFSCYSCGTGLEAMEISPEPDKMRHERLERIQRRARGELLDEVPGMTMAEDGDERLRFFCHLDWHELFAPRCKHCHTPILGEHIVALGEHWHYGHFFCAECGDPFGHDMTHIEKDGYAWCINCQTKRTERRAPKCKMCKKAVIGQYIQALGGEWHEACFRCAECHGGFDDGQIFPKEVAGRFVVLCTTCRTMELKA
ncbi:hypothetical protein AK830_g6553 [Neonectria ditissima]|uniref:LIM zinc-binding domain-containing protein n=1 Tax=Neonectria ditissima TaxID=78410 RepID=A0A0P7AQA7_9HYPO|nr:hypothetical protein AK830_g6553 [Neonectria ditissima]